MQSTAPTAPPAPPPTNGRASDHPVILFDGVCNLCNAAVNFIIDRDHEAMFRFAPLQSDVGQRLVESCGMQDEDTIILVDRGQCFDRSTAALKIAQRLGGGWPLLRVFLAVPPLIRDAVYRVIARYRFDWFGKRDSCRMPTPDLQSRFLAYDAPSA